MELPVDYPKPFRLLDLPSLARDIIFSEWSIKELYHLSKLSRRSRYAVKMFTPRQKYYLNITVFNSYCYFEISKRFDNAFRHIWSSNSIQPLSDVSLTTHSENSWATTKEEIVYCFDVFTKNVNRLHFYDTTNVTKMTEFLKGKTGLPIDWVVYDVRVIDDEMYKYLLREFKNAKKLEIWASPSANFRFDDMEPFTGEYIKIKDADWLTVDHLTRCFNNVERVRLWTDSGRCLNVLVFNQYLNAWRNGLKVGKLDLQCGYINTDLQSVFKNVPKTQVKRVEVRNKKRLFKDGKCFLIRQEEFGVEAIVYFKVKNPHNNHMLRFTTNFRLLRDDESN